ncbi:MAG: squalene/phytoene synthase family protein [Pseudomonadota bacterium]
MEQSAAFDICVYLVRSENRPRYISLVYAAQELRPALCALFAFEIEIARIPNLVQEPMAGELRLQWWRDAIRLGDRSMPLAAALVATIDEHALSISTFDALLDARISDLYADPPATLGDAEGHAGETRSVIYQLACQILHGPRAADFYDRSGHAGVLSYWLDGMASLSGTSALKRSFIPGDILAEFGVDPQSPLDPSRFDSTTRERIEGWVMAEAKSHHFEVFRNWSALKPHERMPYLDLAPRVAAMRAGSISPLTSVWTIWRSARGRIPSLPG